MARCAIVSFRLGGSDGVSVVAETWAEVLAGLGFEIVTVAGEGPVDRTVPGLAIAASGPPARHELETALFDADLVLVENILSIPLNLPASMALADALRGRPALLHHHDPPWQRERFEHITELPPDDPAWRHVTINEMTRLEMAERGLDATTIYNGFDTHPPAGDRDGTRERLGVAPEETLVVHPVRAIERKNIPAALALTEQLGGVYWLLGPAEDGYGPTLDSLLETAGCRVVWWGDFSRPDLYAAADLVAFPSTWEGFGNPPIEAAIHRKPVVVGPYPVADELRALGFRWFGVDEVEQIRSFLAEPDASMIETNHRLAVEHLSHEAMARRISALIADAGWMP